MPGPAGRVLGERQPGGRLRGEGHGPVLPFCSASSLPAPHWSSRCPLGLKDAEPSPSLGRFQLRGGFWLLGFCRVLSLPFGCDHDPGACFLSDRLCHHAPAGSPPDGEGGRCQEPQ